MRPYFSSPEGERELEDRHSPRQDNELLVQSKKAAQAHNIIPSMSLSEKIKDSEHYYVITK